MPEYRNYPMVLNNVLVGMLDLRSDQIRYYGIPEPTPAELALATYQTSGSSFQRNLHSNRLDSESATRQVTVNRTARRKTRSKSALGRGGKAIKIPTELRSTPPSTPSTDPGETVINRENIRFTTIRFPGTADLPEISAWLHAKLVRHKPNYMKSPGGRTYPVVPFPSGNVATGGDATP